MIDEAIGLGVLEPLLADPTVTEIMVNGTDEIYVERDGRMQRSDITFTDEAQLYQTIDRIVSQVNRRVDESSPMVDARLPTGERVNVIIPPLALQGPDADDPPLPAPVHARPAGGMGSVDPDSVALLRAMVKAKLNVVISGGTGAGKTTMLNALSAAVPATERIITVEDNAELRLQQPHVVTLEARPSNVEGRGEISIRDLVRNSLRMRPDRIIVGEVPAARRSTCSRRSTRATRARWSPCTRTPATTRSTASRRCDDERPAHPVEALHDQMNSAIHVIVQIDRFADGARRDRRDRRGRLRAPRAFRLGNARASRPTRSGPTAKVTGGPPLPLPPGIAEHLRCRARRCPPCSARPPSRPHPGARAS